MATWRAFEVPWGTSHIPVNSRRGNAIQPLIFPGVGAQLQADQATDLRLARRQHDDGHVALAADGAAHFQSIDPGQHQIQDDQIRMLAPRDGEERLAIAGDQYLIVGST